MSASRTPTLRPSSASPSARLTARVDLPTPPLPEATAMIASTPGTPWTASPRAVARDHLRKRPGPGQRGPLGRFDAFEAREHLLLGDCHRMAPTRVVNSPAA